MSDAIKDLISQILDKDFVGANATFEALVGEKIQDHLDEEEMKIAAKLYNDIDYDEMMAEEADEDLDDDDLDDDDDDDEYDDEDLEEAYGQKGGNRGLYQKIKPGDHVHYVTSASGSKQLVKAKVVSKDKNGQLTIDHGDGKHNYIYTTDVAKHEVKEGIELSELSGATLGSYYVKAKKSKDAEHAKAKDTMDKFMKSKPETMQKNLPKAQAQYDKHNKKANNRQKGMNRAMDKLTGSGFARVHAKEETEIQELSKKTLSSYIKRASQSAVDNDNRGERQHNRGEHDAAVKSFVKSDKRLTGISKAANKLAK